MTEKSELENWSTNTKESSPAFRGKTLIINCVDSDHDNEGVDYSENRIFEDLSIVLAKNYQKDMQKNFIHMLRLIFKRDVTILERKLINFFDMEWLFDTIVSADKGNIMADCEFQLEYGNFLLKFVDFRVKYHEKVRSGLELFITELISKSEKLEYAFVENIWDVCERQLFIWTDLIKLILPYSKIVIEKKTFEWLNVPVKSRHKYEFYAEMSYHCEELFVMIVTILNEFVILTEGNERVLSFVQYFVTYVDERCNVDKTIFRFYPKEYFRMVSLLVISPELYPDMPSKQTEIIPSKLDVLRLLYANLKLDRNMILLLLTHFPKWLDKFAILLKSITGAIS